MRGLACALMLLIPLPAWAQESRIASDCGQFNFKAIPGCVVTLITAYPFHVSLGNLPPQNGFGFGLAFVEHYTPNENWRINFSADGVMSTSKNWRAGGYVTFIHSKVEAPGVGTGAVTTSPENAIREYPVYRVYVQHISLDHLVDFGPDFDNPAPRVFGQDQTIAGGSAVLPIHAKPLRPIALSLIGGMQERSITIHDAPDGASFFELFEDVRLKPSLFGGHLRLNYAGRAQQFFGDSGTSFNRWTADLRHEIPLYRSVGSTGPKTSNGPNECFIGPTSDTCPRITYSRNLNGSINVRVLAISSSPFDRDGAVPFYLQPTIGGADVNSQRILPSFDDYRFRAPHAIALQASVEHSIWGPIGGFLTMERGKAVQRRSDLDFNDLLSSYSVGLSIRAGGAPMITASYGWNSSGHRVIVNMDASLLGGSSRPSLY